MTGNKNTGVIVQERDLHLLRELGVIRVTDREQAKCIAGFRSTTRANARLLALTRAGLLQRFFIGTHAVGRKALYTLSPKGAILVGSTYRGLRRGRDEFLIGDFFVHHQLCINEVYCAVKYRPVAIPQTSFVRWLTFGEPLAPGSRLIPDGYFELRVRDRIVAAFLEVDLGNETRAIWRTKVQAYWELATRGQFEERFGERQFRVLVVTNASGRTASLRATTAAVTEKIFWFTDFGAIEREGFWSAIWQRPKGDISQALLSHS